MGGVGAEGDTAYFGRRDKGFGLETGCCGRREEGRFPGVWPEPRGKGGTMCRMERSLEETGVKGLWGHSSV